MLNCKQPSFQLFSFWLADIEAVRGRSEEHQHCAVISLFRMPERSKKKKKKGKERKERKLIKRSMWCITKSSRLRCDGNLNEVRAEDWLTRWWLWMLCTGSEESSRPTETPAPQEMIAAEFWSSFDRPYAGLIQRSSSPISNQTIRKTAVYKQAYILGY